MTETSIVDHSYPVFRQERGVNDGGDVQQGVAHSQYASD